MGVNAGMTAAERVFGLPGEKRDAYLACLDERKTNESLMHTLDDFIDANDTAPAVSMTWVAFLAFYKNCLGR